MSHEIRTPLNGIIGMIDVIKYTNLENEQKRMVKNIENASEKLLHVVNEVLDYSKLASEKQEVKNENYDIRRSFEKLSSIFKANIKKNIEICFFVSEKVPEILETDSVKIEKILINLIGNAIKFTKNGEITIVARAEMKKDLECLVKISVEDTGIGIPNDKIDALFTSFMQADESISRIYGGTGLGLAISKQLAELINGTIKVQSKKGVGSKFELEVTMKIIEAHRKTIPVYDTVVFCFGESKISSLILEMISENNLELSEASDGEELLMLLEMYIKDNKKICVIVENISLEEIAMAYWKMKQYEDKIKIFYFCKNNYEQALAENAISKEITLINGGFSQEVIKNILENDNFNQRIEKTSEIEFEKIESEIEDEKLKVIIIEDDEISRDAILTMAKILKVNSVDFSNSFEAINYFENNIVDLVLTDIQLPDISGFEVVRILRKIDSKRDLYTPIIAVSANFGLEYKEKSINMGMDDYLGKPFKIEELYKIIMSHARANKKKAILYKEEMEKKFKEEYIKAKALPDLIKLYNKSKKLMIDALKKGDFQFLRREVHKLKGSFGVAGKNEIAKKFEILEEDIEKMDVVILEEISSLLIEPKKR